MNNVKRYVSVGIMGFGDGTYEDANGNYVRYDDYARIKAEAEMLRKAIEKFLSVNPNTSNPCGCGFWTCETKDLLELNNALDGKSSI